MTVPAAFSVMEAFRPRLPGKSRFPQAVRERSIPPLRNGAFGFDMQIIFLFEHRNALEWDALFPAEEADGQTRAEGGSSNHDTDLHFVAYRADAHLCFIHLR